MKAPTPADTYGIPPCVDHGPECPNGRVLADNAPRVSPWVRLASERRLPGASYDARRPVRADGATLSDIMRRTMPREG